MSKIITHLKCAICGKGKRFGRIDPIDAGWAHYGHAWFCPTCLVDTLEEDEDQKLLDTFAAAALQGLAARDSNFGLAPDAAAEFAWRFAQAMLDERRKRMEAKK